VKETYSLTNPLCALLDKPHEEFCREDLVNVIEEKRIERITFHYTALDGKLKELKVPILASCSKPGGADEDLLERHEPKCNDSSPPCLGDR
jgi:hypothetical protein